MDASADLLINAVISGLLLGGFYAAVSIGVAISFGMLDIVNIAHPAVILLGSYVAFIGNTVFGIDPILAAVILTAGLLPLGMAAYQIYYVAFERRDDQSLRGLSFFFGILFIAEVGLILGFGVDYRSVQAWYTGKSRLSASSSCRGACSCRSCSAWRWWRACRSSCRAPSSAAPSRRWRRTRGRSG